MSVSMRNRNGKLILDIHFLDNGVKKRVRRSTGLDNTPSNRELIQTNIIPEIEKDIALGTFTIKPNKAAIEQTVKEYGKLSFLRHANDRREHVQKSYKNHFYKHIVPEFGKRLILSITPMNLLDWQNKKLKKYAPSTVKKFRSIFYTIFSDAIMEGIIETNPFDRVPKPSVKEKYDKNNVLNKDIEDDEFFSLDEIKQLIDSSKGQLRNIITIIAFSGMRPGELMALEWSNVDFENEIVFIKKTLIRGKFGLPKTKSSIREVEMLSVVKEAFLNQYKLTADNHYNMVFLNRAKKPFFDHNIIAKQFKNLLKNGDRRYLYHLRHSFASTMINHGEDITWISRMMGHKNIDITLKVYAKAYHIQHKDVRKKRATFLDEWHKSGTVNNPTYSKALKIGAN